MTSQASGPAPYPPDTRAKGWRLELDTERIRQSDTWAVASPELRPWLLLLWMTAWEQTPVASLPDDDMLIAARIGMPIDAFAQAKGVLLRGWALADDGRLYHRTLTELVLAMEERKQKERERKAGYRARQRGTVPRDTYGTCAGQARDGHVSPTGETAPEPVPDIPTTSGAFAPPSIAESSDPIFGHCLAFLTAKGCAARGARSFLGMMRRDHGDAALVQAVERAEREDVSDPIPWLRKYLEGVPKAKPAMAEAWEEGLI